MKKTVITLVVLAVVGCAAYFLCKDKCCNEEAAANTDTEVVADSTTCTCTCDSTACAACEGCTEGQCCCENK